MQTEQPKYKNNTEVEKRGCKIIGRLLDEFKELKRAADLRSGGKKHSLTTMRKINAETVDDKEGIVDVFADPTTRDRYLKEVWTSAVGEKVSDFSAE